MIGLLEIKDLGCLGSMVEVGLENEVDSYKLAKVKVFKIV